MGGREYDAPKEKLTPKWTKPCRDCGTLIGFHPNAKAANGSLRPLELTGDRHECGNSIYARQERDAKDDEAWCQQAIQYIIEVNKHLGKSTLRLVREEKQ